MNITIQIPTQWLTDLSPGFSAFDDAAAVRSLVSTLMDQAIKWSGGRALATEPDPASLIGERVRVMTYLKPAWMRALPRSSGPAVLAMLQQYWQAKPQTKTGVPGLDPDHPFYALVLDLASAGMVARPEQVAAFDAIYADMTDRKIGMVEASTGVGKSLAMLCAAIVWTGKNQARSCICAPTLAIVRQLIAEFQKVESVRATARPALRLRVFFGRREFVSAHALELMLAEQPELTQQFPLAQQWLDSKGFATVQPVESFADGDSAYEPSPWLAESLRELCQGFPVDELVLNGLEDESDPGFQAYRAQFKDSEDPLEILICTHAMLGYDLRRRMIAANRDEAYKEIHAELRDYLAYHRQLKESNSGASKRSEQEEAESLENIQDAQARMAEVIAGSDGVLPSYAALLIDEAHVFETSISNAFSEYLALRAILREMDHYRAEGGKVSTAAESKARALVEKIARSGDEDGDKLVHLGRENMANARSALMELRELLLEITRHKIVHGTKPGRLLAQFRLRHAATLINSCLKFGERSAYLRLSPSRKYPQIYLGRDSVSWLLGTLWSMVDSAVCVSATLYLPRVDGPSASYMANILNIPQERLSTHYPLVARWLHAPITSVDVPTGKRAELLRPPTRRDKLTDNERAEKLEAWLLQVANELVAIQRTAAGGTLVLCSSYERIRILHRDLEKKIPALVVAREGKPLGDQSREFLALAADGRKPVWLALGGAWTGLDIGGHTLKRFAAGKVDFAASNDNILTDLVIPNLPFGTNNSITHQRRTMARSDFPWDTFDALLKFKQGLGRLVRREGLPQNRRIWILDGRLGEMDANTKSLSMFLKVLESVRPIPS